MKNFIFLFVACMFTCTNLAAEIYKCTDANGKIDYGDKPCKGESTIFTPSAAPAVSEKMEERREKTRRLLRAYQEEHAMEKDETARLKAEKEKRTQNCQRARNRYRRVSVAGRLYRLDEDGERTDFTEKQRADAATMLKADVEKWCD